MPHHSPLISTIVVGLCLAFLLGAIAQRIRVSPLVGYLLAGVALGPYTPGFVADQSLASELAEIGVILLMFSVGLHFSLEELWSVRRDGVLVQPRRERRCAGRARDRERDGRALARCATGHANPADQLTTAAS